MNRDENQMIIKALNMYGRVPETWELLEEIERLNNIIKEVREYVENNSYFESNIVKTMVLKDYSNGILEILDKGE